MPEETIRAFQNHGTVAPTLERGVDEAKHVFEQLAQVGVDYDDVTATLEKEGVQKFVDSFEELLNAIEAKQRGVLAA
jgi:transaldolase